MKQPLGARLLLIALALALGSTPALPAAAGEDKPTLFGFATHWDSIPEDVGALSTAAGTPPALYQAFWRLDGTDGDSGLSGSLELYSGLGMTPYLEITTNDLVALNSGAQDSKLEQFIRVIGGWLAADSSRGILIAPLPEANLYEHDWGGDPAGYKDGYRHIRSAFIQAGLGPDVVRWVFAMNGISGTGLEYDDFYPGDDLVDVVGFSKLNRGGSTWRDYDETFDLHIREMQDRITTIKPILITQTGTVDGAGGDRDTWLDAMFAGLQNESQVVGAIYFNRDKDHDYRVVIGSDVNGRVAAGMGTWSAPSEVSWFFDGRLDQWVAQRADQIVFDDIGSSSFEDDILWVAEHGITLGCSATRYCPDEPVTRGQMASFLARALSLPASGTDWFTDDDTSSHESNIDAVADAGITFGCGSGRYCESDLVTRDQMASFLARALTLPASSADWFADDDGSTHETNINAVADAAITLGCGSDRYCPDDLVTRGQMAAFLHRALG